MTYFRELLKGQTFERVPGRLYNEDIDTINDLNDTLNKVLSLKEFNYMGFNIKPSDKGEGYTIVEVNYYIHNEE